MTSEAEKIEGYYTPQEAAREFRVAEKTIRNMCERGEIEGAVKIGRQWRVPASWVFSKKAA